MKLLILQCRICSGSQVWATLNNYLNVSDWKQLKDHLRPRCDSDTQLLSHYASSEKFTDSNQAAFQILTNIKHDYPTRVRANVVARKLFTSVKVSALSMVSVTKICPVCRFQIEVVVFEHEFGAQFWSLE